MHNCKLAVAISRNQHFRKYQVKKISIIMLAAAGLLGAGAASAQSMYGQVGTTGVTLGYAKHFDNFNVRGDVNFLNYGRNFEAGSVKYDAKLKFSSVGLFADYFPIGQFRVTGGVLLGNDKLTARGEAGPGSDIPEGEWVKGEFKSQAVRPYLGVGWGFSPKASKGLSFAVDLGASYGAFKTDYSVSPGMEDYWGDDRIQKERRELDDKVSSYKWFPVVRVGLAYRF